MNHNPQLKPSLLPILLLCVLPCLAQTEPKGTLRARFLDDLSPQGVGKVRVSLSGAGLRDPLIAESDASGNLSFPTLAPATYRMSVDKAEYFAPDTRDVVIAAGSTNNLGELTLVRKRRISGTVRWQDGEPVPTATVQYLPVVVGNAQVEGVGGFFRTNERGEYSMPELRPGRYAIFASYSGNYAQVSGLPLRMGLPSFYPSGSNPDAGGFVDVRTQASVSDIAIVLQEKPGFVVEGRVEPSSASPLGSEVSLILLTPRTPSEFVARAVTKAGERFKFLSVPEGEYVLVSNSRDLQRRVQPLVVGTGGLRDVRVTGPDAVPWQVTVEVEETVEGQRKLSPAPGVGVRGRASDLGQYGMSSGRTDAKGTFKTADVAAGDKYVLDFRSLPPSTYVYSVTQGPQVQKISPFQFVASTEPVRILLHKDGGSVSGTVFLDNGSATPAFVVLAPKNRKDTLRFLTGMAAKDGTFNITAIAPGAYDLFAFSRDDEGWYHDEEYLKRYSGRSATVVVEANGAVSTQPKFIAVP
ncbi:MAG: carboxypeptidase regulatory-like domain-containing protein [Acidobacteriota bacterium]